MSNWTHRDSESLYNVSQWGKDYFRVNAEGHVEVTPSGPDHPEDSVDLDRLLKDILRRGIEPPLLVRFNGILRSRIREMVGAFERARQAYEYEGGYRPVYPIKVNQQRHVVDVVLGEGRQHGLGLEVGSKPELLAVLAMNTGPNALMICNGYKDREYVELALFATHLGVTPIIVIEKFTELDTVLDAAEELGIEPVLGVRTKLGGPGAGRWRDSVGDRSKFGLTTRQIVQVVDVLEQRGKLDRLQLLHFHIGSQITNIRSLKNAMREATRTLVGLVEAGAAIEYFDVGGGLGIDYDGSSTNFESSRNYTLQEYANDVVYQLAETCREHGLKPPTILTESGRALTAHHAVLITEVIGVSDFTSVGTPDPPLADEHEVVHELAAIASDVTAKNFQEAYHDAIQQRDEAMTLFNVGQLGLPDRARCEEFYWHTLTRILALTREMEYVPDDLGHLERDLCDTYFVNCSIFQSMPDSWAIGQLFPVLPLHRLDEEPTRRGILADMTCDSDGRVDRFIDLRDVKRTLELHPLKSGEPYYVAFFLVGAYQEILGDMHNLFGDTNVVNVETNGGRPTRITNVVRGDRVKDVLSYLEYTETELIDRLRENVETAIEEDRLTAEDSARLLRRYVNGLAGYTYLTRDRES